MNNVFGIQKPETIRCLVARYEWGKGMMTLRLSRLSSPDIYYLRFQGVEVFAGPMQWENGNFVLQPPASCLEVLQMASRASEFATERDIHERKFKLYTVDLPQMSVQIVCTLAVRAG
jgi:hypothetical protein